MPLLYISKVGGNDDDAAVIVSHYCRDPNDSEASRYRSQSCRCELYPSPPLRVLPHLEIALKDGIETRDCEVGKRFAIHKQ